jgi:dolichol-phosphate mannosyltransferase
VEFSDVTVIIPTLNEKDNVPKLIRLLQREYKGISIIVADDGSKDGTKAAVLRLARSSRRVRLLDRSEKRVHGLTASVLDAAMIVDTGKTIVMDGDLQHPYQKVRGIAKALDNHDIVIGVRSAVEGWTIERRLISTCMSSFAYIVFVLRGIPTSGDMMSGFFGIRSALFKSLIVKNRDSFVGQGYKVLLDTLRLVGHDAKIGEVSYATFQNRKYGKSKLSRLGINHASDTLESVLR